MPNKRDIELAERLLGDCEELIEDFVRDNIDMDLDPDDMYEQYATCIRHIKKNLFREEKV